MTIRWVLLLLLPVSATAFGEIIEVEPGGTYQVRASATQLTSVGMADQLRLNAVFGMENQVSIQKDEEFGRAIIKPVSGRPFTLILTDENGDSYSLSVTPGPGPGGVITLKRKSHQFNESLMIAEREMPFTNRLKRTIKQVVQGKVPSGYEVEPIGEAVPLWVEADFQLVQVYRGGMTIEHYVLTNVSGVEMRLDEREFAAMGSVISVAIRNHVLPPYGKTDVFIVKNAAGVMGADSERS